MEACPKPAQPLGSNAPVAVAAGPSQQVDMRLHAFQKARKQFGPQGGVVPRRSSKIRVEIAQVHHHVVEVNQYRVKAGFNAGLSPDTLLA